MQLLSLISVAFLLSPWVAAAPTPEDATDATVATSGCSQTLVRKEWYDCSCTSALLHITFYSHVCRRALSKKEQLAYLDAVKCLQSKPAKTATLYPGVKNRYDDFQAVHIAMTERIHFVVRPGASLPLASTYV